MTLARKRERAWRVAREREREIVVVTLATRAWRVTRKLGDFGRERERVPGESLESIGKNWKRNGLDGRDLHRSILEKYCKKELHLDRLSGCS